MHASVADWITAISSAAYTLLTAGILFAAVKAWATARAALIASQQAAQAAREANLQASLDSIQSTRPYVFVELLPGLQGAGCYDLRVANAGKSAAKSLHLNLDEWPDESDSVVDSIRRLFNTHRTLPPGCSIRAVWRVEGLPADSKNASGMPRETVIHVCYTSDDPSTPHYEDSFEVSASASGLWPVPEDGGDPEVLKGDAREFYLLGQALVRRIGELGR